ncbi:MAG TPA: SRPBCC family protein [Actinomycetota bacterium]|nr:SRPBCC family protein [Actinomycetota bacterium]
MKVTGRIDIAAPMEWVFRFIADPWALGPEKLISFEWKSGGPHISGSEFVFFLEDAGGVQRMEGRCDVEPPRVLRSEIAGSWEARPERRRGLYIPDSFEITETWDLEPHGAGTRIACTVEYRWPNLRWRLAQGLRKRGFQRAHAMTLLRLKERAEGNSGGGAGR